VNETVIVGLVLFCVLVYGLLTGFNDGQDEEI